MRRSKLLRLRALIELAAKSLNDKEALDAVELYPAWSAEQEYQAGIRVQFGGLLYRCLQDHRAQAGWDPAQAVSLWARVLIQEPGTVPQWVQPDSTNPYKKGDRVTHQGKTWISLMDGNVWEPGVYGWEEAA